MIMIKRVSTWYYITYGKYKDLTKRTQLDKVLKDKACKIASNSK